MRARPPGHEEIPDWLSSRAEAAPHSPAVECGKVAWSYSELDRHAGALAALLRSSKVGPGDRVAVLLSPSETFVALVHAASRLGAVVVPLNHRLTPAELRLQLKDAAPKVVVFERGLGLSETAAGPTSEWIEKSELQSDSLEPLAGRLYDIRAPHAIIYTSGSSGSPKGAVLTLWNLKWNHASLAFRVGTSNEDRWLLCLPLFHIGGYSIIFRALLAGSLVVVHPRFDPSKASRSLRDDRITLASFVPTMLTDVLAASKGRRVAPSARLILVGGGRPSAELAAKVRERDLPVAFTYGMTETCSFVALSSSVSPEGPRYLPAPPSEVVVTVPSRRGLSPSRPGEVGEIAVRGPSVFAGYWRRPQLTRSRFLGGWFLTGDLGRLDPASGELLVLGREDETIVTGGEKVFPEEVESALRAHPSVSEAVVLGVEDGRWGQMVVAVIEPRKGPHPTPAELKSFLERTLAGYKIPKKFLFRASLPRTPTGKLRKADVRRETGEGSP